MADNIADTIADKTHVRPVLLADGRTVRDCYPYLRRLLVGLTDQAYCCVLVCPERAELDYIICPSVEHIRFPFFKLPLLWRQNRRLLLESLGRFKPTVLHCCCRSKVRLARVLSAELDIPYVMSYYPQADRPFAVSGLPKYCTAVIAFSDTVAEEIRKAHPDLADRLVRINVGTFVRDDCACFSDPNRLPSLVVVRRLDNFRTFQPLLEALKHLMIDGFEFVTVLIGTGSAEKHIHRAVKDLGLGQTVTTVPHIQPLSAVFEGADIFVQLRPDSRYAFTILDAVSAGMAVAAGRGCEDQLLREAVTSVFFDSTDPLSIYSCLKELLSKREFARKLAASAQDWLRKNNTVSEMVQRTVQTYLGAQKWYRDSKSNAS